MRNRLITAASAAALSLALAAGAVSAQDAATAEQLRGTLTTMFAQNGWDTSVVDEMSDEELVQVHGIAVSGGSPESQATQIISILGDDVDLLGSGEAASN